MRTLKMNFAFIILVCLTFTSAAQDYNPDAYKWGAHPEDFDPPFTQMELAAIGFKASCHISRTKAIYTALQEGDVTAMDAQMAADINWSGQTGFPRPVGDPHFNPYGLAEGFFNKINSNWINWQVYELTYEETANSIVTVKGHYKATRNGIAVDTPFVQIWTWKNSYVAK